MSVSMLIHFIGRTLDDLEIEAIDFKRGTPKPQPEPSRTEWQRCLRAAYRFQLLCQVSDPTTPALGLQDIASNATVVFLTPEPWEIEELMCVYDFAQCVYKKVFDEIKAEVHPGNPRFDDQGHPPTPDGAFEFDDPRK